MCRERSKSRVKERRAKDPGGAYTVLRGRSHRGIRVNTLNPGVTDTRILYAQTEPRGNLVKMYPPMIRSAAPARAEEVAKAAPFDASDQTSHATGAGHHK